MQNNDIAKALNIAIKMLDENKPTIALIMVTIAYRALRKKRDDKS